MNSPLHIYIGAALTTAAVGTAAAVWLLTRAPPAVCASSGVAAAAAAAAASAPSSSAAAATSADTPARIDDAAAATAAPAFVGVGGAPAAQSIAQLIGGTPLLELRSLSAALGVRVLGKCEFSNPGGSGKDRLALALIRAAEASGALAPGGWLVEGTSGSTGVSLALLARALGYRCHIVMPDDQAAEKAQLLRACGATLQLVRPAAAASPEHYVNAARRAAAALRAAGESAVFCDQFESPANAACHYASTGPEIWRGSGGRVTAFVMGAGTGGTLAGVAAYLSEQWAAADAAAGSAAAAGGARIFLVDPPGSSLFNRVAHGVAWAPQQAERTLRRHRADTVVEGVGCDRVTANFALALPHLRGGAAAALRCSDAEAVAMSRYLLANEGLFCGSSTALHCVGVVRAARRIAAARRAALAADGAPPLPPPVIVTLLCDGGGRHLSRFWSDAFLESAGLACAQREWPPGDLSFVRDDEDGDDDGAEAAVGEEAATLSGAAGGAAASLAAAAGAAAEAAAASTAAAAAAAQDAEDSGWVLVPPEVRA